jgi:membrane-bound lytic murein transglycosylase D
MIKKHLIACSGMLVLMVVAKLFIYSTPSNYRESFFKTNDFPNRKSSSKLPVSSMSFANEDIPLNDPYFLKMVRKELTSNSFENTQTSSLHENAEKWFPVIETILRSYSIPEDFKYLPLVESGLKKGTSSNKGASGYWQFMPGTARHYGLRVDSKVDERQDMQKSTIAACKYMRSLFKEFKSWTLVAAAYNTGEDKLHAQINRQNERNYFSMRLNKETASYVYKLISMKEIIENPAKYGYVEKPLMLSESNRSFHNYFTLQFNNSRFRDQQLFQN